MLRMTIARELITGATGRSVAGTRFWAESARKTGVSEIGTRHPHGFERRSIT